MNCRELETMAEDGDKLFRGQNRIYDVAPTLQESKGERYDHKLQLLCVCFYPVDLLAATSHVSANESC